jgi:peroxiredoxin
MRGRLILGLALAGVLATAQGAAPAAGGAELGQPAPDFTLPDLAGKPVRLAGFRGQKTVLLNFWATWCVPCREEMPTLERLSRERRGSLVVLGINVDVVGKDKVQAFVRELGLTFPILLDPETVVGKRYRVRALPTSFLIDRDGVLRHREVGYRDWTSAETRYLLDEALRRR